MNDSISFIQSKALVHKKMDKEQIHMNVKKDSNENDALYGNEEGEKHLDLF